MQDSIQEDTKKYVPLSDYESIPVSFSEEDVPAKRPLGTNKELGLMKEPLRFKSRRDVGAAKISRPVLD